MALEEIVNYVLELIRSSGAWGVIIGVLIESVLAPIPSPIIIMGAGFIMLPAGAAFIDVLAPLLLLITLPGALASTIGSFIGYFIGYFGGKPLIKRFEWLLGVSWEELSKGIKYFQKGIKDEFLIFTARAVPIIPLSVFSAVAGVLRINIKSFAIFTFLGALVRLFFLGIIGWLLGSAYENLAVKINTWENIGLVFLIGALLAVFFLVYRRVNSRRS
ncbi:MAG: VTT domain-containing protein [Nanoarchaeota archaeon]|nr:VTT domain-containing protein [Nanoarchaeota archaeon]